MLSADFADRQDRENVMLLHLGCAAREAGVAMGLKVLENALAFFAGKEPPNRVA